MITDTVGLIMILGVPLAAAALLLVLHKYGRRVAGWIAGAAAALSLGGGVLLWPAVRRGEVVAVDLSWIPEAGIDLALRLDGLAFPFLITAGGVTLLAIFYAWGYHRPDEKTSVFYALLLLFAAGMAGTVLADDMFLFYVFWELMLVASCILIAVWGTGERRGPVALKYFIFTHIGSLLVLVGVLLLYTQGGSDQLSALEGISVAPNMMITIAVLFMVGFCVKMAIFPLHLWLPDAHAVAPMPVTIMLAAAMLSMGTYGVLRFPLGLFSPADLAAFATPLMIVGIVSEVYGALMALAERDIKRIIAYSSVSQMGYILFGLGTLVPDGLTGAVMHVVFHAIVKALLFMGVGLVMHATGRRRISEISGLGRAMPVVAASMVVGALAIAGTPPLVVFDSEWMIFTGGFEVNPGLAMGSLFSSLFTVAYALWFVGRLFFGERSEGLASEPLPWQMVVPTVLLAVLTVLAGLFPEPVFAWGELAVQSILGGIP